MHFPQGNTDSINTWAGRWKLHAFGNLDPLLDAVVRGDHEVAAPFNLEFADHPDVSTTKNANDSAFCPALAALAQNLYQRPVTVHALLGLGRRQENVGVNFPCECIGNKKPETIPMNRQAARDEFRVAAHSDEMTRAQFDQQPFVGQTIQRVFERVSILACQAQLFHQLLISRPAMRKLANMSDQTVVVKR